MSQDNQHLVTEQREPVANEKPAIWPLVIKDMEARHQEGMRKYKTPLQPLNGRNAIVDGYQEVLDLAVYQRQLVEELSYLGDDLRTVFNEVKYLFEVGGFEDGCEKAFNHIAQILKKYPFLTRG